MSLKLYRPGPGGLEPQPDDREWRQRLRSRRWRPAAIQNPEADEASPLAAILLFATLAIGTFILLVLGYGIGFWA